MSQILDYIDKGKEVRVSMLQGAIALLDQGGALSAPRQYSHYGYNLTGTTIAKYKPWEAHSKINNSALNAEALFNIRQLNAMAPPKGLGYELGIYNGGVSRMLLDEGRRMVCFDTFEGVKGSGSGDMMEDGEYACDSEAEVCKLLQDAIIVKGDVRVTLRSRTDKIAFAHLDMDVYAPTSFALKILWDRLQTGGIIVCDDYGVWCTEGVRQAVDEFLDFFPNAKSIYFPTGQMAIIK